LQYYLAALLHDIGKLDLPLRDASKLKGPHPIKGNLYLQDFYRNEYNNELKIILPAVTLHHDNVVRDYPNHEIVKAAIETKNYCPTSKSILDAVQKSDRSAASASRDRYLRYPLPYTVPFPVFLQLNNHRKAV
jgi:CRISPR/Cas system-associated protein Cas10 (large subunit of type III CRISPR-Cas system)